VAAELGFDQLRIAKDEIFKLAVVPGSAGDAADHRGRAAVAAHCVDRDSRAAGHAGRRPQASVETISRPL
jgi:hypothetical protein